MKSADSPICSVVLFASVSTSIKLAITFFSLARKRPVILMQESKRNSKLVAACPSLFNFSPTPLYAIDYYGQMQTVCQTILRDTARIFSKITYKREPLVLSDGGTVGLDWVHTFKGELCNFDPDSPTVIIMHGLCGDSNAEYLVHLVETLIRKKFRVVVMVARGCGGVALTTPVPFNGARTLDFKETVEFVHARYPHSILFGMGFSLGATLTLKYMSEYSSSTPLAGAMAISPPWDFHCDYSLAFKFTWTPLLCLLLKGYVIKNYSSFKDIFWKVMGSYSIKSFDSVTCPLSGYRDVDEYYDDCSATRFMHKITKPTLAISSVDDPICNVLGCPRDLARFGEGLITVIVEHGGHLGFAEDILPLNSSWIDRISLDWFDAVRGLNIEQLGEGF